MGGLAPLGRVAVAPNLHFEMLQRRAVLGLEEQIEDVRPLRLGVIHQEAGAAAAAAGPADAGKDGAPAERRWAHYDVRAVDVVRLGRVGAGDGSSEGQ